MKMTTESVRICLDITLRHPRNGRGLIDLADAIEDVVRDLRSVASVRWVESTAAEPDFDYSEWNAIMVTRRAMRNG